MSLETIEQSDAPLTASPKAVSGNPFTVGDGFTALSFKHGMYAGAMDPMIMVDHFIMTEPTFGPHAHAGLSAVSNLFEDSQGQFHNKDSLGNDIDLKPGDLYWLKAGRGAVHDEKPRAGSRTHALQVFVNLPARMKYDAPDSLHVKASNMPILSGAGYRARVMLGRSGQSQGLISPALPMTILDIKLEKGARFVHSTPVGQTVFLLAVDGAVSSRLGQRGADLVRGTSVSYRPSETEERLVLTAEKPAHIALLQAAPVNEPFVQRGPFAMSTEAEVAAMFTAHADGKLGSINT